MTQKLSIIGGAGFVGTNLCHQLAAKGADFEILDLKLSKKYPSQSKICDIRDITSLKENITGEIIIHLAAVHRDDVTDKTDYTKTNVDGAKNIISVSKLKNIKKIVFTSTVAVYGFACPGTGESGPINPFNEYGKTKFEAEQLFRSWYSDTGGSLIIIRPTVIFGEGNRGNVYNLFKQIASGRFVMIGSGTNKKSMAYISNVVHFLETCIKTKQSYGVYNYVDTPNLSMNQLVEKVRATITGNHKKIRFRMPYWLGLLIGYNADIVSVISGKKLPISSIRIKKFISSSEFTTNKSGLDNFKTLYELDEAIQNTIDSEFISPDPGREIFYTE